jgi:Zn-dependent protease
MFKAKEAFSIILAALVIGYLISFKALSWQTFASGAGLALLMLFIHHLGQKFTALFYDCSTESRLWTVKQFSFAKSAHFRFDFPMWAMLPVFAVIFSFGLIKWLAVTTFEACPLPARVHRKYAELTEFDLGLIAVGGLFFNALLAIISQAFGYNEFAMLNLYFILFNLIPVSTLDGGKIFFGSVMLWVFSAVFAVIMIILLGNVSVLATIAAAIALAIAAVVIYYVAIRG